MTSSKKIPITKAGGLSWRANLNQTSNSLGTTTDEYSHRLWLDRCHSDADFLCAGEA
jgi:hypothetical protein